MDSSNSQRSPGPRDGQLTSVSTLECLRAQQPLHAVVISSYVIRKVYSSRHLDASSSVDDSSAMLARPALRLSAASDAAATARETVSLALHPRSYQTLIKTIEAAANCVQACITLQACWQARGGG
jgi:hypothetical protein